MYYVYILKSANYDQIYTGVTIDLRRRFREHNYGSSKHTSKFTPWVLLSYISFYDKNTAYKFEKYLKTGSGIAFARKHLF